MKSCLSIDTKSANEDWFMQIIKSGGIHPEFELPIMASRELYDNYDMNLLVATIFAEGHNGVYKSPGGRMLIMSSFEGFFLLACSWTMEVSVKCKGLSRA